MATKGVGGEEDEMTGGGGEAIGPVVHISDSARVLEEI